MVIVHHRPLCQLAHLTTTTYQLHLVAAISELALFSGQSVLFLLSYIDCYNHRLY